MVIDVLRPLLQPGRSQLLTIAQGIVRTLLNREAAALHERSIELVAMGLTKYNIDVKRGSRSLVALLNWNSLSSGVTQLKEKERRLG
jgi:hypothetical protein